jgi:hypothetical protein
VPHRGFVRRVARSFTERIALPRFTSSCVPAMNIGGENATCSRRSAVLVVAPHSRSMRPLATCSMRFAGVTRRYFTGRASTPSAFAMSSTMARHRSTE